MQLSSTESFISLKSLKSPIALKNPLLNSLDVIFSVSARFFVVNKSVSNFVFVFSSPSFVSWKMPSAKYPIAPAKKSALIVDITFDFIIYQYTQDFLSVQEFLISGWQRAEASSSFQLNLPTGCFLFCFCRNFENPHN